MIFTFGILAALLGSGLTYFYGTGYQYTKNTCDFVGYAFIVIGAASVLWSLLTLACRYLP